ncbi:MAG: hypothetical protein CML19_10585 [Pusillimonas sp.]|jgi:hypothetical protein|nr:hypothetical protein [Pusillimonas sp.]
MDLDPVILWNIVLTVVVGPVVLWARSMAAEVKRIDVLLNKTREETARDFATKRDLETDVSRVLAQLDKIDKKLDRLFVDRRN